MMRKENENGAELRKRPTISQEMSNWFRATAADYKTHESQSTSQEPAAAIGTQCCKGTSGLSSSGRSQLLFLAAHPDRSPPNSYSATVRAWSAEKRKERSGSHPVTVGRLRTWRDGVKSCSYTSLSRPEVCQRSDLPAWRNEV